MRAQEPAVGCNHTQADAAHLPCPFLWVRITPTQGHAVPMAPLEKCSHNAASALHITPHSPHPGCATPTPVGPTLGQTVEQLKMVLQRISLYASSRFSSRSAVKSSRLSIVHLHSVSVCGDCVW